MAHTDGRHTGWGCCDRLVQVILFKFHGMMLTFVHLNLSLKKYTLRQQKLYGSWYLNNPWRLASIDDVKPRSISAGMDDM